MPTLILPVLLTGFIVLRLGLQVGSPGDERSESANPRPERKRAQRDGRPGEARLLVTAGADVKQADPNGISPLLDAILNNHLDVARCLPGDALR